MHFAGRLPCCSRLKTLFRANSYTARSDAYLYLLTETYPPFRDEHTRPPGVESLPDGARVG